MEFLKDLKLLTLPLWAKLLLGVVLFVLLGVNMWFWGHGAFTKTDHEWTETAATLMAAVLPMSIIALIVSASVAGDKAITNAIQHVLVRSLPQALTHLTYYSNREECRPKVNSFNYHDVMVAIDTQRTRCDGDYTVYVSDRHLKKAEDSSLITGSNYAKLIFRVELNVWRANIVLFFSKELVRELFGDTEFVDSFRSIFGHSIEGAEKQIKDDGEYIYCRNESLIEERIAGRVYIGAVFVVGLSKDFVYEKRDQLFFCQDLAFFLKALLRDAPYLFEMVRFDDIQKGDLVFPN